MKRILITKGAGDALLRASCTCSLGDSKSTRYKVSDRDRDCESRANNLIEGFPLVTRCCSRELDDVRFISVVTLSSSRRRFSFSLRMAYGLWSRVIWGICRPGHPPCMSFPSYAYPKRSTPKPPVACLALSLSNSKHIEG